MLLKDCPVGSFVRLVSISDKKPTLWWWDGEFKVFEENGVHAVKDADGEIRSDIHDNENWQFEIVTPAPAPAQHKTITLNGKTYKLKPHTEPRLTVIDGVTYEMEEI